MASEQHSISGEWKITVYYEDTDLSGFVYHSNYLKFFERAREHLVGLDFLKNQRERGIHFVVSSATLSYKRPARHGDELVIKTEGLINGGPSQIYSQIAYLDGNVVVEGKIKIATLNSENRPVRLPQDILDYLVRTKGKK